MLLISCQSCYVLELGYQQNNLFNSRISINEIISNQSEPTKIIKKLDFLNIVLEFAQQEGLNSTGAYSYYIPMKQSAVSYLVQGSSKIKFEAKKWWFPIVGSVPYKGYFDKEKRDLEAAKLQSQGYDIYKTGVAAFSSLGWFEDPVYQSMLSRDNASFANLIFHELTHRTFWFNDSVKFNENLASFVGDELTIRFLKKQRDLKSLDFYQKKKNDKKLFYIWLKKLKKDLNLLYSNANRFKPTKLAKKSKKEFSQFEKNWLADVLKKKEVIISKYISKKPSFMVVDYIGSSEWNNAKILSASMYSPDLDSFSKAYLCSGFTKVGLFLEALMEKAIELNSPSIALKQFCQDPKRKK